MVGDWVAIPRAFAMQITDLGGDLATDKRKAMLIRCESDLYDVVIKKIEREINEGNFSKEYLEIKE